MKALVTGAAGFIGSTLANRLLSDGWSVRGVDCFTPYYPLAIKQGNVRLLRDRAGFKFVEADLRSCALPPLLDGIDTVFHLAGQPGVRLSWADGFTTYVEHNVVVTQRLLEEARACDLSRLVFASSSSVYGNVAPAPTREDARTYPYSPYGVTKLAAEHLCTAYAENFGVPSVSLRYFTVYGPRQRPDMALHRLIDACLKGGTFTLLGGGDQVRDFTFIDDVVDATVRAASARCEPGAVMNIAGAAETTMNRLIGVVESVIGSPLNIEHSLNHAGDVSRTSGDIRAARETLGWEPHVSIEEGVARQVEWQRKL